MTEGFSATELIRATFPEVFVECHQQQGDETVVVRPEGILPVARFLKEDPRLDFNFLMDLAGVDYPGRDLRFEVVYHFYSLARHARLRVKVRLPEDSPAVDSLTQLWKGADWYEREVWDMFGVRFHGHPGLKRILMYEEFEGHPLRKDYPSRKRQPLIGPLN
jgi:NADH-quinone oxidoreductase subunit C